MKHSPLARSLLGKRGETLAASYLGKIGYRILTQNFQVRYGELDIIAIHKDVLVFVEVKTRIGDLYGSPEEAVTPRKLAEVVKTAEYYKSTHPDLPESMRVDVIAIEMSETGDMLGLRHIENVTQ